MSVTSLAKSYGVLPNAVRIARYRVYAGDGAGHFSGHYVLGQVQIPSTQPCSKAKDALNKKWALQDVSQEVRAALLSGDSIGAVAKHHNVSR